MGACYRCRLTMEAAPGRDPDVDAKIQKEIAYQKFDAVTGSIFTRGSFVDCGKYVPYDELEVLSRDTMPNSGLVFCLTLVSEYGDVSAQYYLSGVGFCYSINVDAPPVDPKMLQKAVDEKLALRREADMIEAKKVSARQQALNKLTVEERKLLGLK